METRFAEESGPDEDHHTVRKFQLSKVIDDESPEASRNRGVLIVDRKDPVINAFLNDVPDIIKHDGIFGLIWDKNLQPADHKYEKGEHYLSTREADRKTVHATVSYYRDGVTGAKFAVKTLKEAKYFHPEEIKVGLAIQHPNVCSVYGIIIRNGTIHILLEHAGLPLLEERAWIAEYPKRIHSFAKQSFQALEVIHLNGFIHCDIKPDNIMITKHDSDFTVKLIDFGSCHAKGTRLPRSAPTTLLYWSPEIWQALNKKDEVICNPAMDVYALALTLSFVHTSSHLMQRFENQDLQNLMINAPDDCILIALPDTISPDLYVVMKNCLDGKQDTRMSAHEAVKQLTEDTMMRWPLSSNNEENYKDSLTRMFTSLRKSTKQSRAETALFKNSFSQEKVSFASSNIGSEKRESKTVSKFRKNAPYPGNKFSKPLFKGKKCSKALNKNTFQKIPLETIQSPLISADCELEDIEASTDDRDYLYSNLLKNLALHVREPQQGSSCLNKSPGMADNALLFSKETKLAGKLEKTAVNLIDTGLCMNKLATDQPVHRSHMLCEDKPDASSQRMQEVDSKMQARTSEITEKWENLPTDVFISPPSPANSDAAKSVVHVPESNPKTDSGSSDGGMDFVFSVFDDNMFTGDDDDIINNWCIMLDKDEQTMCSHSQHIMETDSRAQPAESMIQDQATTVDEPVVTDDGEKVSVASRNKPGPPVKGSRKRMTESTPNPSGIPEKVLFYPPSQNEMSMPQLPKFDQILPS